MRRTREQTDKKKEVSLRERDSGAEELAEVRRTVTAAHISVSSMQ